MAALLTVASLFLSVWIVKLLRAWSPGLNRLAIAALTEIPIEPSGWRSDYRSKWFFIGLIFLGAAFTWLEATQPNYFAQDDALVAEMPGMLEGCRAVWNGHWPDYDPCRCMGGPLAGEGIFSLTYPPTYLCYFIARDVLRNENDLLDVFAAMHFLAGYCITFRLCRRLSMRPMLAAHASLAFLLSGSVLIMGRSWHTFMTIVVWAPLMLIAIDSLSKRPARWRWCIGAGLISAMLYHAGFPQLWMYAMLFGAMTLVVMVIVGRLSWRAALLAIPGGLIALGFIFPLMSSQLIAAAQLVRTASYGSGVTFEWIAAIFPYPIVRESHPMGYGSTDTQYMGHFIYFGTLPALVFVGGWLCLFSFRFQRWSEMLRANVWMIMSIFVLLMCMGQAGGLYWIISVIPRLQLINNAPFRALPFAVLLIVISAGIISERLLQCVSPLTKWPVVIVLLGFALLGYHVWLARPSFYTYGFRPYPVLPEPIAQQLSNKTSGRLISWSPFRSIDPGWSESLPLNLPMVYGVPALNGYDPVLEFSTPMSDLGKRFDSHPIEAMRAYGVRWHLFSRLLRFPVFSPNPDSLVRTLERAVKFGNVLSICSSVLKQVYASPNVLFAEFESAAPLAFAVNDPKQPLPMNISTSGVDVDLRHRRKGGNEIVINFLDYPSIVVTVDGKTVPSAPDAWGRVQATIPHDGKKLQMRYDSGWGRNSMIGLAIALLGGGFSFLIVRRFQIAPVGSSVGKAT